PCAARSIAPIVAARPHPRLPRGPDRHQENAALHNAVLKHVVVLLVPADRRVFKDQTGPSHEGQCFWVAPRTAVTLSAKRLYRKDCDPQPRQSMQPKGGGEHFIGCFSWTATAFFRHAPNSDHFPQTSNPPPSPLLFS